MTIECRCCNIRWCRWLPRLDSRLQLYALAQRSGGSDLAAIVCLAGLMLGWPGAAAAAVLGALSPWHLAFSRFGQELSRLLPLLPWPSCVSLSGFTRVKTRYLLLSGVFLGLSLYSYSVARLAHRLSWSC